MEMGRELVLGMAELARLEVAEDELDELAGQMERMSAYMEVLGSLEADREGGGEEVSEENTLREDRVHPSAAREALLKNAAGADGEMFVVPKAVD